MPEEFATVRRVTQLELENFGKLVEHAEEADGIQPLTVVEIREREMASREALKDRILDGELPSWADMYHRLIQAGWKWRIAAYVAWASTPSIGRYPETLDKLAKEVLGLTSPRAIFDWRKKYPSIDQMIADLQADDLLDARADVFRTLKLMARTPDYKNVKYTQIYLEMIGAYIPTSKLAAELKRRGITPDDLSDMSDAQLREIAGQAMDALQERDEPKEINEAKSE